jgi:hypothetical protein
LTVTAWRVIKATMRRAGIVGPMACPKGLRHGFDIRAASRNVPANLALKQAAPRFIRERFNVTLERLDLRGSPCITLEEAPPARKSIMASRSFGKLVETRDELAEAVRPLRRAQPSNCDGRRWPRRGWSSSSTPTLSARRTGGPAIRRHATGHVAGRERRHR